jgi:hypothetical protein
LETEERRNPAGFRGGNSKPSGSGKQDAVQIVAQRQTEDDGEMVIGNNGPDPPVETIKSYGFNPAF